MNIFLRILLTIYAFFMAMLSFLIMVVSFNPELFNRLSLYLANDILPNRDPAFIMFAIALMFFGISITFLLSGFKSNRGKKAVSKLTNIGEIMISMGTLENIALGSSKRLSGVKETKANLVRTEEGVSVTIRAVVLPDVNIPALSEDIQVKVKKSIEESTGVMVKEVKVYVDNIYSGSRSRVE